jgi:hypothetical protein
MVLLACAYASRHRSHATREGGGSNTIDGRFSLAGDRGGQEQVEVGLETQGAVGAGAIRRGRSSPGPASPCPLRLQKWGPASLASMLGSLRGGGRSPPLVERVELPLQPGA